MAVTETQRRDELLDGAVAYVLRCGIADLSLRPLAAALGTSDRMLVYHFGSKAVLVEALLDRAAAQLAVLLVGDVASREAAHAGERADDRAGQPPPRRLHQMWQRLSGPEAEPYVRLWFEVYGLALRGHEPYRTVTARTAAAWLDLSAAILVDAGLPPDRARRLATVEVAVVEGLLLDLLATGDRARVDRAAAEVLDRLVTWRDG